MTMRRRLGWMVVACATWAGCGSETPTPADAGVKPLIPVALGNRWTYRVTSDTGVTSEKVQTITSTASSEGRAGYRFETTKGTSRETVSVQALIDGVLVRYEERTYKDGALTGHERYVPSMVRIDSNHTTGGETYQTEHTKEELDGAGNVVRTTVVKNRFEVESTADVVEVPAGRFTAVRLRRVDMSDGSVKTYWYVAGLGKVKETGGQTEELVSLDLAD